MKYYTTDPEVLYLSKFQNIPREWIFKREISKVKNEEDVLFKAMQNYVSENKTQWILFFAESCTFPYYISQNIY